MTSRVELKIKPHYWNIEFYMVNDNDPDSKNMLIKTYSPEYGPDGKLIEYDLAIYLHQGCSYLLKEGEVNEPKLKEYVDE